MTDLNSFKTKLEAELKNITTELEGLGIHNPLVAKDWIPTPADTGTHDADQNVAADRSEDLGERRGTLEVLEARFNNLNRALQKITDNKFGICEICSEKIEADRLEVNPAARTCKTHLNEETSLVS